MDLSGGIPILLLIIAIILIADPKTAVKFARSMGKIIYELKKAYNEGMKEIELEEEIRRKNEGE
jgi:Sec-independent protein translocase protein TatA